MPRVSLSRLFEDPANSDTDSSDEDFRCTFFVFVGNFAYSEKRDELTSSSHSIILPGQAQSSGHHQQMQGQQLILIPCPIRQIRLLLHRLTLRQILTRISSDFL